VQRKQILEFAAKHRLPAMYELREFVDEGGLMTYGTSFPAWYERSAYYVDRILKGAKALGLTIPQSVLLRADQVIQ
jgi:putative ABC transport system substrate-binding protein